LLQRPDRKRGDREYTGQGNGSSARIDMCAQSGA
jgi:hypothetical protein